MDFQGACFKTRNADRMVEFYRTLFGAEPEVDGDVNYGFAEAKLTVFRLTGEDESETRNAALMYATEDVDRAYARLQDLGIAEGDPPTDKPWGVRSFIVTDPDGNVISLFTRLS